jgi:hypothetical protein
MVQKFEGVQMSVSGFGFISICQTGSSKSKNRDKQLTFIVRVIASVILKLSLCVMVWRIFSLRALLKALVAWWQVWLLNVLANRVLN